VDEPHAAAPDLVLHLVAAELHASEHRATRRRVPSSGVAVSGDVRGPTEVFEGESAVFYSRSTGVEVSLAFSKPGRYAVPLAAHGFAAGGERVVDVRPLPPFVASDRPLVERLATIQLYVQDGDRSALGRGL